VSVLAHAIRRVLGGRGTGVLDDAGDEALCYVERFSEPGHFGPGRAGFLPTVRPAECRADGTDGMLC
jgi:hypothetical protein